MADILPINTWFCFGFVSSVHRVPFNNVQLQVYIIKIKIVLYTQLSQLSYISLELSKHNIITMCCHTMYLGKKCFFHIISKKKCALGKTPLLPLGHVQLLLRGHLSYIKDRFFLILVGLCIFFLNNFNGFFYIIAQ